MVDQVAIMVVDDSKVSRMMIKSIVSKMRPDWLILEAESGEKALELAEGKSIKYFSFEAYA
ncbi:MAG: hypothetical protein HN790_06585 [Methylococcales bacterium]|jgi:two-component system, chemotaxis family, chemotaxis protein CheY|nr:hypothetical protein [Methylococcales bacterium]